MFFTTIFTQPLMKYQTFLFDYLRILNFPALASLVFIRLKKINFETAILSVLLCYK
jgi:hypothetical protein